MKKIFFILIALFFSSLAMAQVGELNVKMDDAAQNAVSGQHAIDKKWGYTICLYADNSQSARQLARRELSKVRRLLPYEPSTLQYENPFFKVYVGRCYDKSEAVRLLGILEESFPRAVIAVKEFSLSVFGSYREIPEGAIDSIRVAYPKLDSLNVEGEMFEDEDMTEDTFVNFFNQF